MMGKLREERGQLQMWAGGGREPPRLLLSLCHQSFITSPLRTGQIFIAPIIFFFIQEASRAQLG